MRGGFREGGGRGRGIDLRRRRGGGWFVGEAGVVVER